MRASARRGQIRRGRRADLALELLRRRSGATRAPRYDAALRRRARFRSRPRAEFCSIAPCGRTMGDLSIGDLLARVCSSSPIFAAVAHQTEGGRGRSSGALSRFRVSWLVATNRRLSVQDRQMTSASDRDGPVTCPPPAITANSRCRSVAQCLPLTSRREAASAYATEVVLDYTPRGLRRAYRYPGSDALAVETLREMQ